MEYMIIAYDIIDDRRRGKVHNTLKDFGVRVQYSVFECKLPREDYLILRYRLEKLINKKEDSVIFYRQCLNCSEKVDRVGSSIDPFGDGLYMV